MKKMQKSIVLALAALFALSASAQQINTLYFLENAPMRHTINPAFRPYSDGYLSFLPLGWTSMSVGNNSFTVSDLLFVDRTPGSTTEGMTITPFHPNADRAAFLKQIRPMSMVNSDFTFGILNLGCRTRRTNGFFTFGINERVITGVTIPQSIFQFVLNGGMTDLTGVNTFSMGGLGGGGYAYSEISGGYSQPINEKWSIGGKFKLLLGLAYAGMNTKNLNIDASTSAWNLNGNFIIDAAGPINMDYLNKSINGKNMMQVVNSFTDGTFNPKELIDTSGGLTNTIINAILPSGYGAAIDFGFTYKPIENLQISAALTDLGFIYWTKSGHYSCTVDTVFQGAGMIDYSDPTYRDAQGHFSTQVLMDTVKTRLLNLLNGVQMTGGSQNFIRMTSARLNIGVDANFWNNRVGVGILSATRLYDARLYEEITIGASFRPVRWFNIAVSYSLMNNGKYSNIGAGLSLMPYDGINLMVAMDYIPTSYAAMPGNPDLYVLPDKTKMFNLAFGLSFCWGTNQKDKDHDGIWDRLDQCPDTPRGVVVDSVGCPVDIDRDGVPDYLDRCNNTRPEAILFIDKYGCDLDSDGDGVPDYQDMCPDTPREAWGSVDHQGCPKDSDGDGVDDYLDKCPDTPVEAKGKVDEHGCVLDSDGDGIDDVDDECPNTPKEAIAFINEKGCNMDSDDDGIPDYKDECPTEVGLKKYNGCPEEITFDENGDVVEEEIIIEEKTIVTEEVTTAEGETVVTEEEVVVTEEEVIVTEEVNGTSDAVTPVETIVEEEVVVTEEKKAE